MRVFAGILAVLLGSSVAVAQGSPDAATPPKPAVAKPRPKAAAKPKHPPMAEAEARATTGTAPDVNPTPATQSIKDSYAAIPPAERMSLQSDLVWTGDYNGLVDGAFSDRLAAAVRAYQRRHRFKDTGVLNPQERATLAAAVKPMQDEVGWQYKQDPVTGARLGLPLKLATQSAPAGSGTRWSSLQGQLQIETFRLNGTTPQAAFEQQKRGPFGRRTSYSVLRPDFFVVSGMQGLKKFYVRASAKNGEVRGITVLYDQAMEGTMDAIVVAMSSAFVPFPDGTGLMPDGSIVRRRVEYGTGIVVSAAGYIVTDRQLIEGCKVIVIPGFGNAERASGDKSGELALIRIYGARHLTPIGLLGAAPSGGAATLVGIADPQAQGGGDAITAPSVGAAPAAGFSGAAALDARGRFAGMAVVQSSVVAGPNALPQTNVIPRDRVVNFLEANYVAPASGRAGVEAAKASVVRVICVRK